MWNTVISVLIEWRADESISNRDVSVMAGRISLSVTECDCKHGQFAITCVSYSFSEWIVITRGRKVRARESEGERGREGEREGRREKEGESVGRESEADRVGDGQETDQEAGEWKAWVSCQRI